MWNVVASPCAQTGRLRSPNTRGNASFGRPLLLKQLRTDGRPNLEPGPHAEHLVLDLVRIRADVGLEPSSASAACLECEDRRWTELGPDLEPAPRASHFAPHLARRLRLGCGRQPSRAHVRPPVDSKPPAEHASCLHLRADLGPHGPKPRATASCSECAPRP